MIHCHREQKHFCFPGKGWGRSSGNSTAKVAVAVVIEFFVVSKIVSSLLLSNIKLLATLSVPCLALLF